MKKLIAGLAVGAMAFTLGLSGINAAGEDTKDVDVTYDNSESITDPTDPDAANWGVKVPTSIQFTDTNKSGVDASIELVGLNGYDITTMNKNVDVTVTSAKGMKLMLNGSEDGVTYELTYGSKTMSSTASTPITLNLTSAATKQPGSAKMTGTATKKGLHKDVITYKVALHK